MSELVPTPPALATRLLRATTLLALLIAAWGPRLPLGEPPRPPLRVLDVSASMGPSPQPIGAGSTGEDVLLFADGVRLARRGEDLASLPRGRTRLAEALRAAAGLLGEEPGVVWLVSDGLDTEGGGVEAAADLAAAGHRLDVAPPSLARADVGLVSARLLAAGPGSVAEVGVRVAASVSGRVRVSLRRGATTVDVVESLVTPVAPLDLVLRDPDPPREPVVCEVALVPLDGTPDDDLENDRLKLVVAGSEPLVVLLDPEPWPSLGEGMPRARPLQALDAAALEAADLAIVSDLPWRRVREAGAERLARQVAGGATLLVLGGPQAYGPGGWHGTPLERLLPLVSAPDHPGTTALLVLLDHSGSTGESAPEGGPSALASLQRALAGLLDGLPPSVRLAVLGFASGPDAAPLTPGWVEGADAAARARLLASANLLTAGGGTDLDGAIVAAARTAAGAEGVRRRRVILLTDGDPDHALSADSFAAARAALAAGKVEFGAVVRGDPRGAAALATLAARPEDVASITSAGEFPEALLSMFHGAQAREELVEGAFRVTPTAEGPEGYALEAARPTRLHRLELAPEAVLLATAAGPGDAALPYAAQRVWGSGRIVALAGGPALEPPEARAAFRQALAPLIASLAAGADRGLASDVEGGRLSVRGAKGSGGLEVFVEAGARVGILYEASPGLYEGALAGGAPEDRPLFVARAGRRPRPLRGPVRPALEHRAVAPDEAMLAALAQAGGGTRLAPGETPRRGATAPSRPLAPLFLLLALALLVAERVTVGRTLRRAPAPPSWDPGARPSLETPSA